MTSLVVSLVSVFYVLALFSINGLAQPNMHSHGSVTHDHPGTRTHSHFPNLPQPAVWGNFGNFLFGAVNGGNLQRRGSMTHSHSGPEVQSQSNLPQATPFNKPPNTHQHGSVSHSHSGPEIHTHGNMPEASWLGGKNTHSHGSMIHSHGGPTVHTHPNLPEALVAQGGQELIHSLTAPLINSQLNLQGSRGGQLGQSTHSHGSVLHSHGGPAVHSHPNLPQATPVTRSHSGSEIHTHGNIPEASGRGGKNTHRHGSMIHSHGGPTVHSHPNLPQASFTQGGQEQTHSLTERLMNSAFNPQENRGRQLGQSTHSHGSVIHSHGGPEAHSNPNLPHPITVNTPQGTHHQDSVTRSHSDQEIHTHGNIPGTSGLGGKNTHRHGSMIHSHGGPTVHSHPNLPEASFTQGGQELTHSQGSLNSHSLLSNKSPISDIANMQLNQFQIPENPFGRNNGLAAIFQQRGTNNMNPLFTGPAGSWGRPQPELQQGPNYELAGGAICNSQCASGRTHRSCPCARYMCFYQGCSSRCQLIREGDYIRAECQEITRRTNPLDMTMNSQTKCNQPMVPGSCTSRVYSRYGYDRTLRKCRRFVYSGCGGNDNRFSSRRACIKACE